MNFIAGFADTITQFFDRQVFHGIMDESLLYVYLALALAAFVKYILPPLPGDAALLMGVFYVGLKGGSWSAGILLITMGGFCGALLAYLWGTRFGRILHKNRRTSQVTERVEGVLHRWGWWALMANRFVPYIRTLMYPAAGYLKMPLRRVVIAALAGNFLFGILVVLLGYSAGMQFSKLQSLYQLYQIYLGIPAVFLILLLCYLIGRSWLLARRVAAAGHGTWDMGQEKSRPQ